MPCRCIVLSGALGNFATGPAYETAKRLEELGAAGDLDAAREELGRLDAQMRTVREGIEAHLPDR